MLTINLIDIILFIAFISDIYLATLLLSKSNKKESTIAFAFSALSVGFWTLGILCFRLSSSIFFALFWNMEFILSSSFIASTFLHFAISLSEKKLSKTNKFLLYIPNIFTFVFLMLPNAFIRGIEIREWGKESILGYIYPLFALYFTSYVLVALFIIYKSLKTSTGIKKNRLSYIFIATLLSSIVGTYFNLFLILIGIYKYIWVGPLNSLILVFIISYAITKQDLMDIKVVISRTASYGIVATLIILSFLFVNLGNPLFNGKATKMI